MIAAEIETTERGRPGKDANLQVSGGVAVTTLDVSGRADRLPIIRFSVNRVSGARAGRGATRIR
jgi:hypothetical protein